LRIKEKHGNFPTVIEVDVEMDDDDLTLPIIPYTTKMSRINLNDKDFLDRSKE
jgi:hypothetical protein